MRHIILNIGCYSSRVFSVKLLCLCAKIFVKLIYIFYFSIYYYIIGYINVQIDFGGH